MKKSVMIALIVAIPIVILAASHAHTLASENYFKTNKGSVDMYNFEFTKSKGLNLYFESNNLQYGCPSGKYDGCSINLDVIMYVGDNVNKGLTKSTTPNGFVNFSWDEVQMYIDNGEHNKIRFSVSGTVNVKLQEEDNERNITIPSQIFSINDDKFNDKKITICLDDYDKTIYKSEWEDYKEKGAKKGTCNSNNNTPNYGGG